jgi:hypothetical protein
MIWDLSWIPAVMIVLALIVVFLQGRAGDSE